VSRRFPRPLKAGLIVLTTGAIGVIALPADAATKGVVAVVQSTVVEYPAAAAKTNKVVVTRSGRTITIDDTVAIRAGAGCTAYKGDKTRVRCTTKANPTRVRVYLNDRNDSVVNKTDLPMTARGDHGNDRLTGGPRGDNLDGGFGTDLIWGLGGNDQLHGSDGNDGLSGGDGNDLVWGNRGNDHLFGGRGNDELMGNVGNDVLDGGLDGDMLTADTAVDGSDTFIGGSGPGVDQVSYSGRSVGVVADADGVQGDDGQAGEKDTIGTDVEGLIGGSGNDRLLGTNRSESLSGGAGNDTLAGSGGNDSLEGGAGRDNLNGAGGDDYLSGDDPTYGGIFADTVHGGPGRDTVSYAYYTKPVIVDLDGATGDDGVAGEKDTVGADVEDISGGSGHDRLTGNAAANRLDGAVGNDTLIGLAGDDELIGFLGQDTLTGGDGDDNLDALGSGTDQLDGGPNGTEAGDYCQADETDTLAGCER
jgi:Ca2+-binding RTX toxin-like protein